MSTPEPEPAGRATAAPFLAAAAVVAVVAIVVAVLSLTRSPEDNVSENQRVGTVVAEYVEAAGQNDGDRLASLQCAGITNAPLRDAESVDLDTIDEVRVNGDAAEVDVTVTLDGSEQTLTWNAVRQDGAWKICSS
ncbi:Rv0361 family membrane protein [Rhodococcoides kroppenstedtii]|uniref:Rv0361 family membrane protein n=1 Tax=Rhodococcoides kroppenstedtii TaxID=293050 RepID=UPI0036294695